MNYKWYTLAVYSGYETKVCNEIDKLRKVDENIKEVFVSTKKTFKIVRGKRVETVEKLFPNYVFVNMNCNRTSIDKLRDIGRVIGFIGSDPLRPQAVLDSEIEKMKKESEKDVVVEDNRFEIGDVVRIKDGHFESFNGTIESKDEEKNILKISITIFGRNTIIEIDSSKVERV